MNKLLLILFLIPNLVIGKEFFLSCNGSAIISICIDKLSVCEDTVNENNVPFDIEVNVYENNKGSIYIAPNHPNLVPTMFVKTEYSKDPMALTFNEKEWTMYDLKPIKLKGGFTDKRDIKINRLTGNFRFISYGKLRDDTGKHSTNFSGNCRKVTSKKF
jgi:hypothetical protein